MGQRTASPRRTDPHAEAWGLLQEIMMGQRGRLFAIAAEFDLAPMQAIALKQIEPGEPLPMSKLAQYLHCDNSNVTGIVDRLEERGLVERRVAAHDRRIKQLVLTDRGAEVRTQVFERLHSAPEPLHRLSAAEQRTLRDLLKKALAKG